MADIARSGLDSYEFARRLIVERGVAVAPGGTFGDEGNAAVRLSLASPPETITEGIRRIGEAIREHETDATARTTRS
jgi:aspartate/methionine/tyrosine aminotransferase